MIILLMSLLLAPRPAEAAAFRCSIPELRQSPDYMWPLPYIERFVDSSEVIVRARAVGAGPRVDSHPMITSDGSSVRFAVVQVLRGDTALREIVFGGRLVEHDDFSTMPVPRRTTRPGGQHGNCFATDYTTGAEYLLLLRRQAGVLTPYWEGLAPLNEQLRGPDDPWLGWVRSRLEPAGR
jgi:hypothetical protein